MTPIFLPEADESVEAAEAAEAAAEPVTGDPETDREEVLDPTETMSEPDAEERIPEPEVEEPDAEEPLIDLQAAVARIPESLRKEMADLLRADFREVIRWKPPRKNTSPE